MAEAVLHVLDTQLYLSGHTRSDLARYLGVSRSTVKRRLEASFADYEGGLDGMVEATAAVIGRPPIELWESALSLWQQHGDSERYWQELKRNRIEIVKAGPMTAAEKEGLTGFEA